MVKKVTGNNNPVTFFVSGLMRDRTAVDCLKLGLQSFKGKTNPSPFDFAISGVLSMKSGAFP
jgi:hypothetical protein